MASLSAAASPSSGGGTVARLPSRVDVVCIVLISAVLAAPYVWRLGFYSDDWTPLVNFHSDMAAHRFGIHSMLQGFDARPLQGIYFALLFYVFRLDPLGYHLVNTAVLTAGFVAVYWLLLRIRIDRGIALAATVVLIVLPQLSTARVWLATFQVPLSMLLAILSLHAQLSFAKSGNKWWIAAAAVSAILSIAAYETFAPLILAFPLLPVIEAVRQGRIGSSSRRYAGLAVAAVVTVALSVVAKIMMTERGQSPDLHMYWKGLIRLVKPDYDWRLEGSLNIIGSWEVNVWQTLVGFERGAAAVLRGELGVPAVIAGIAVAALSLWALVRRSAGDDPASGAVRTLVIGLGVFLLGHAAFLVNSQMLFSPTGMGNRSMVAAAPGLAMMFVGLIALALRLVAPRQRQVVLAGVVATVALLGSWRIGQISNYWAEARTIHERFIADAKVDLKDMPAGSSVVVDGVCPYHGPAVVLETWWDASAVLTLALDRPIDGDSTTDRMQITPTGLATSIYEEPHFHPFGSSLYVYDTRRHRVVPLPDVDAARAYFLDPRRQFRCPTGYVGQGVLI